VKIRLYSHTSLRTGYARAADELAFSLLAAGAELEIVPLSAPPEARAWTDKNVALKRYLTPSRHEHRPLGPDVIIVHTLPYDCARVLEIARLIDSADRTWRRIPGCPLVAYTTWEGYDVPPAEMIERLQVFDLVLTPNMAGAADLKEAGLERVDALPHAYDDTISADPSMGSDHLDLTHRRYRFYSHGAWSGRKNPSGVIRAFARAFTPADNVELRMFSAGTTHEAFAVAVRATGLAPDEIPPIRLISDYLTDDEVHDMHRDNDCFVSATRGEAWNLPCFEAMLAGRHIITTMGVGSDDYLARTSAERVSAHRAPAQHDVTIEDGKAKPWGAQGLTVKHDWLEPNLLEMASAMRDAYDRRVRDLVVNYDVANRYGRRAVGASALRILQSLRSRA